jgi:hypothetical protein
MQFGRKSTQKKWIVQIKTYKNAFFEKKIPIFLVNSKKSSTFARFFGESLKWGPENFNFWGEREHGENSYERIIDEVYLGENCKAIVANRIKL